jgi:hypothetical protein
MAVGCGSSLVHVLAVWPDNYQPHQSRALSTLMWHALSLPVQGPIYVCHCDPVGNVIGEFDSQVLGH